MASDVHRQFLFEPNPFVWDEDFRAMKAAGVNLVRTGIWTGWKKFMPEVGKLDEAALRALDAFLLTARQYDIPVIWIIFNDGEFKLIKLYQMATFHESGLIEFTNPGPELRLGHCRDLIDH